MLKAIGDPVQARPPLRVTHSKGACLRKKGAGPGRRPFLRRLLARPVPVLLETVPTPLVLALYKVLR